MESTSGESRYVINWKPTLLMLAAFFAFFTINLNLDGLVPAFVRIPLGTWVMLMVFFFNQGRPRHFLRFAAHTLVMLVAAGLVWWLGSLL